MYISRQKREENIAEFVLYMWQIEDVIRACNLDLAKIEKTIIANQDLEEAQKEELKKWYKDLCNKMKIQKIEKVGHLREVNEVVEELSMLHNSLLTYYKDEKYIEFYSFAEQFIDEFKKVSNNPKASNIEVMFTALYAKLILKLQGKDISSSTEEAFDAFRNVLAYLASKYKQMQNGELSE
ncbi:DUF4924 family protein [Parvicella tangerina]|uniref:DUF4924 family protein n=1 Tax=Parvicella tangerina TaxID=2829795 RepID=A0A916JPK4_9FLAO|nr:DUF4924 family protein [Parvicella tangerina]CAG5085834.1 hypothetical protein CRYO30217_02903 [Parvicella tangerina]